MKIEPIGFWAAYEINIANLLSFVIVTEDPCIYSGIGSYNYFIRIFFSLSGPSHRVVGN